MAYNLILSGASFAAATPAAFGQALTSGYGTVAFPDSPIRNAPVIRVKARINTTSNNLQVVCSQTSVFWLGTEGVTVTARYGSGSQETALTSSGVVVNDGNSHEIMLSVGPAGGFLFLDGVLVATNAKTLASVSPNFDAARFVVGGLDSNGIGFNFSGAIAEVPIYNNEVTATYSPTGSPATTTEPGLVAIYRLDGDGSATLSGAGGNTPTIITSVASLDSFNTTPGAPSDSQSIFVEGSALTADITVAAPTGYEVSLASASGYGASVTVSQTGGTAASTRVYVRLTGAGNGTVTGNLTLTSTGAATKTVALSGTVSNKAFIQANHPAFRYSFLNWLVTSSFAKSINSGAYFEIGFSGATCILNFDLTGTATPLPQILISVNNAQWQRVEIASNVNVQLPAAVDSTSPSPAYKLRVVIAATSESVDRWITQASAVKFKGLTLDVNATLTPVAGAAKKVLFFGDSITEGVRTLGNNAPSGKDTDRNDAAGTWAYEVGRLLGAEFGVIGFGATGLSGGGSGSVPAIGSSYNYLWKDQPRDFSTPPDLIILNETTNDRGDVTASYTALLNNLLAISSNVKVLALEPFNNTHGSEISAACAACTDPSRATFRAWTGGVPSSPDGLHPFSWWNLVVAAPPIAATARPLLYPTTGGSGGTGGGLTMQNVRDALLLAPSAGLTPASSSTELVLRQIQTQVDA